MIFCLNEDLHKAVSADQRSTASAVVEEGNIVKVPCRKPEICPKEAKLYMQWAINGLENASRRESRTVPTQERKQSRSNAG